MHSSDMESFCDESLSALYIYFYLQILPGVRVIIVNPETRGPLGDSHLGEVTFKKLLSF